MDQWRLWHLLHLVTKILPKTCPGHLHQRSKLCGKSHYDLGKSQLQYDHEAVDEGYFSVLKAGKLHPHHLFLPLAILEDEQQDPSRVSTQFLALLQAS